MAPAQDFRDQLVRYCFAEAPDPGLLADLGKDAEAWQLYRRMIRNRIFRFIAGALPRYRRAVGGERFDGDLARWLESGGSAERQMFLLPLAHARWLLAHGPPEEPAWAGDLLRLEAARIEVRNADDVEPGPLRPFDFQLPLAVCEPIRCLQPAWDVTRKEPHRLPSLRVLIVWRGPKRTARTAWAEPWVGEWLCDERAASWPSHDLIRNIWQARGVVPTTERIEHAASVLGPLVEAGAVASPAAAKSR